MIKIVQITNFSINVVKFIVLDLVYLRIGFYRKSSLGWTFNS